jgi:hypothetical protein
LGIILWYFWSFPWICPVVLIYGLFAYYSHKQNRRKEKLEFDQLAQRCKAQRIKFMEYFEKLESMDILQMQ